MTFNALVSEIFDLVENDRNNGVLLLTKTFLFLSGMEKVKVLSVDK